MWTYLFLYVICVHRKNDVYNAILRQFIYVHPYAYMYVYDVVDVELQLIEGG